MLATLSVAELVELGEHLHTAIAAIGGGGLIELERALHCRQEEVWARAAQVAQREIELLAELMEGRAEFAWREPRRLTASDLRGAPKLQLVEGVARKLRMSRALLRRVSDMAAKASRASLHPPGPLPLPPLVRGEIPDQGRLAVMRACNEEVVLDVLRASRLWASFMTAHEKVCKAVNLAFSIDPPGDLPVERRFELKRLLRRARYFLIDLDGREPEGVLELLDELEELTALTEEPPSLSEAEERQ